MKKDHSQNASRSQNFKIFTFSRGYCGQTVRRGASVVALFCTRMCPLVIPPTRFRATPKILPQDPRGPSGIKFWQLYLGPLFQKNIPNFRRKSIFSRVTRISHLRKEVTKRAPMPSISGPKLSQLRSTFPSNTRSFLASICKNKRVIATFLFGSWTWSFSLSCG